jgi:hypothetical protein
VAALSAKLAHLRVNTKGPHHSGSRPPSQVDATSTLCWYHRRYGAQAQNCTQPCSYCQQEKQKQRTSAAAHVCATTTDRPFITDRLSKRKFLVDMGSDLSVYPRRLILRRKDRDNYDLSAANGTTIPTYGWLPLSLNLGLRRNFTWRFVVADFTHPLIGNDFLSHFGLLVDCKHNRLIGQHSRFLPVSRGARTTYTGCLRPTSEVQDHHKPSEVSFPNTRNPPSTRLPNSQDRQSALLFPGYAEQLQAISAPCGGTPGTTSRRALRLQNQGNSPYRQNSSRPSNSARRACHAPLYWHAPTHPCHLHLSQTPPRPP